MKKIPFIIVFLISVSNLFSQNTLTENQKIIEGLNNYLEFIHQTTHFEFVIISDLEGFNSSLIRQLDHPTTNIYFKSDDALNNHNYYFSTPHEVYVSCINSDIKINISDRTKINTILTEMMSIADSMQIIYNQIDKYVNEKEYIQDSTLYKGFYFLEKEQLFFEKFRQSWVLMKSEIDNIENKYITKDISNPYMNASIHLDSLFDIVYEIAEAARINDTTKVRLLQPILEQKINYLQDKDSVFLKGAKSFGANNGQDPFARYKNIISDAKAELNHVNNFLKPTKYPQYKEKKYGKAYYYYNYCFINKFNRHGIGMAYDYNQFADYGFNYVLKKEQLPHIFKVIYPEPEPQLTDTNYTPTDNNPVYSLKDAPANNMVFLLDVSGSMNTPEKLPLLKDAMKFLISQMRGFDYITIVTYSGVANTIIENISAAEHDTLFNTIDNLVSGGQTNLFPGLKMAYNSAIKNYIETGNNRIIIATDGSLNTNQQITKIISKNADKITLSIFYFDKYDTNFNKLKELSDLGNGNCTKIDKSNIKRAIINEAKGE